MKRFILTTLLTFGLLSAGTLTAADTYSVDGSHSDVSFKVRHLVSQVRGHFDTFDATIVMDEENLENSSVTFTVDAASINTRNEDRDKHLRSEDFFHTEQYPEITFTSSSVRKVADGKFQVVGTLTMRGVEKKITLPVSFHGAIQDPWGGTTAGFSVETVLDRQDYGINWNKAMDQGGFVLGDEVAIEINLETKLQTPAEG